MLPLLTPGSSIPTSPPHTPLTPESYISSSPPFAFPLDCSPVSPTYLLSRNNVPLSLAVPLGLTLPAPSPPSPLELAGASSYLPPLDFSDLFSPTLLLGSEKDKMSPASARSQAQTGIATGTVPATGSGSSHPSHSFPSHGTLGSEYQSATQAQGQVSQERSTASPGSVQPQNGSGNATANATQAPVSASEWSAKSSQATNLQVQVHLQLPSQLPGLLPQLPESVVQPARPFQTSPKPQTSQRSEVLQSEPAHAPQLPHLSSTFKSHTFPSVPLPSSRKRFLPPIITSPPGNLSVNGVTKTQTHTRTPPTASAALLATPIPTSSYPTSPVSSPSSSSSGNANANANANAISKLIADAILNISDQSWHPGQANHAGHHQSSTTLPPLHVLHSQTHGHGHEHSSSYAPPYPYGALAYQHQHQHAHAHPHAQHQHHSNQHLHQHQSPPHVSHQHQPSHQPQQPYAPHSRQGQPFTYQPATHTYGAPHNAHAHYAGGAVYSASSASYTPMTASYHSSSSSLSGAPPPFVHPSVIQPGVFGGGHGWDPSRRTVSGSAFAPESERQRALHAEVKDEDRWDERQPVSPAMSQGSEGEPEMEQGLQHPQVQAQVGMLYRNGIIYTDDADTKQTAEIKRKCYNCESINPPSWRKSTVQPGKIACNKCGIYERTHRRARPRQDDDQKFRRPTPVLTPIVHRHPPTEGLQVMDPSPDNSPVQSPYSTVPSQTPGSSTSASFPPQPSPFSLSGRRGSQGSLMSGHLGTPLSGATGTPVLTPSATPLYGTPLNSSDIMGYYALHHPSASAYANASPLASAAAHGRPSPYHQAYANRRAMTYPYHPLASLSSPVSASTSHSHSHTGATPTVNALSLSQSQSSNATAASLGGNPHSHSLPNGNYLGSSTSTSASISTSTSTGMPHSASASGESEISGSVKASVFGRRYSDADANREVKPDVDMSPNADAQPSEAVQQ